MTGRSAADVAGVLGTTSHVIELLEAGAVRALPPWPETQRIVLTYGSHLRIDTRPILERIAAQVAAPAVSVTHSKAQVPPAEGEAAEPVDIPTMPPPAIEGAWRRRRRRRARRTFLAISAPMVVAGLGVWLAQAQPPMLVAAVNALPGPISRPIRSGLDYLLLQSAPRRDGLRWVEVADPRLRKSDRMRVQAQ